MNKDTASYFIIMKKMAKNKEKISAYIGYDHFDPSYI